ncbi:hypothetical protein L1049_016830 [Liquidambar formosana]|uniref:RING-type domain-containing protein n=1 Tax=Liquidambar formosana TaxID=63359 RepID=A0AAP0S5Y2_LIQFO
MGVVFLIAIGVIIMIASLCYCIRHCIGEPPAGQPAIAPAPVQLSPLFRSSHHLDAATIQTFAEIPFRAGEGDDSCTICLQSYTDGEFLRGLPSCPHRYHHKCIEQWLTEESTSCPQCKYDYIDQLVPIRSPV